MLKMPGKPGKGAADMPAEGGKEEAGFKLELEPVEDEAPKMLSEYSMEELQAELARRQESATKGAAEGEAPAGEEA